MKHIKIQRIKHDFHQPCAGGRAVTPLQRAFAGSARSTIPELVVSLNAKLRFKDRRIASLQREVGRLRKLAYIDELTNLPNYRAFKERLEEVVQKLNGQAEGGKRRTRGVQLLMIDLRGFKSINDTFGHEIGDQALKLFAQTMKANLRRQDYLARRSGDEFLAILPYTNKEGAEVVRNRISVLLDGIVFQARNLAGEIGNVHVCAHIGHCLLQPGMTPKEIESMADAVMYQQKQADPRSRANGSTGHTPAPS